VTLTGSPHQPHLRDSELIAEMIRDFTSD
jgi:hypothetical protein